MGSSLGARLFHAGVACDFVTRNVAQTDALKRKGFPAFLPEEMTGKYGLIFLATKQRDNAEIAAYLDDFLEEDGILVTVQNGLPEPLLAETFGADRVYGCALGWGAETVSPGEVRLTSEGELHLALGAYGKGERLEEIATLLRRAFTVRVGDLHEIRFAKLTVNASFSTLSAISSLTFGELARKHGKLVLALARETVAVAQAYGCRRLEQNGHDILRIFKSPFARLLLPIAMKKHAQIRSGMLKDIIAGRRCDVDFVAGAVVEAGKKKGVKTPMLSSAVSLVHDIENGLAELSEESLSLIL